MDYAIDENVLVTANGDANPQADEACQLAAIKALEKIQKDGVALLDSTGEVLGRYRAYCDMKGQPGVGDAFLKHLHNNQANEAKALVVELVPDSSKGYSVFPDAAELKSFDANDRIWVALVLTRQNGAKILNAVDSDYQESEEALTASNIEVEELCTHCLKTSS